MKNIFLYGAGVRGKKVAKLLDENGIEIKGFCDSVKMGKVTYDAGGGVKEKDIFNLDDIDSGECAVIITIVDAEQAGKVKNSLVLRGIEVITTESVLFPEQDIVERNRKYIAEYHNETMDDYYENAESKKQLLIFWHENSIFKKLFAKLDLNKVIELACGRGRHVPQYIYDAQEVTLVDILEKNIHFCRERYNTESKIQYYINNGYDLRDLRSGEYTALFTYDAMVHFEMLDIFQYLKETYRVLVSGGRALFHHSNNTSDYRVTFSTGQFGRNYMSKQLFAHLADRAGFIVLEQHIIDWGGKENLDCVTLVEKP